MKRDKEKEKILTQSYLKERLDYDPKTGIFIWKPVPTLLPAHYAWNKKYVGTEAGKLNVLNYREIMIKKKRCYSHRVAWCYVTGSWPVDVIDHIDRNPLNNRFENLREANTSQNQQNRKIQNNNTSGVTGVIFDSRRKSWTSVIKINKKTIYLGSFVIFDDAALARKLAEQKYFGEFAAKN